MLPLDNRQVILFWIYDSFRKTWGWCVVQRYTLIAILRPMRAILQGQCHFILTIFWLHIHCIVFASGEWTLFYYFLCFPLSFIYTSEQTVCRMLKLPSMNISIILRLHSLFMKVSLLHKCEREKTSWHFCRPRINQNHFNLKNKVEEDYKVHLNWNCNRIDATSY